MAFSIVRGPDNQVWGFWFSFKPEEMHLLAVAVKKDLSAEVQRDIFSNNYRVVPNTSNNQGGFWVMLDSRPAPGETLPKGKDRTYEYWKCPQCGSVLEKGRMDLALAGATIVGTATCGVCGAKFPQSEVYAGKYDIESPGKTDPVPKKWWQFWK